MDIVWEGGEDGGKHEDNDDEKDNVRLDGGGDVLGILWMMVVMCWGS